jgi:nucleoside-diphosphate-sugar epimerase
VYGLDRPALSGRASGLVISPIGGVGVETSEFFDYYARMLGRRRVPTVPTSVALAAAGLQSRIARARGTVSELTPDGVRYLALRRGTYGIATARDVLDWTPQVGLAEGMSRTEAWARERGLVPARIGT